MWQQGPKISSLTIGDVSGRPVQMVGSIQAPFGEFARHVRNAAAGDDRRAFFGRLPVVAQHLLAMLLADQRAEVGRGILRTAELQGFRAGLQTLDERVEDRTLNVDALGAEADLSAIGEARAHHALDRLVEIGVGEHERGILAAEFERHLPDAERRLAHDRLARAGLAGEGDAVDERMLGEELAGRVGPEAMNDVVDAFRDAGRIHHLAEQGRGERRLLGRLDDDRVAAGERRTDLPGHQKKREVPRRDHRDHALGFSKAVVDGALAVGRGHDEGLGRDFFTVSANILKLAAPRGMSR